MSDYQDDRLAIYEHLVRAEFSFLEIEYGFQTPAVKRTGEDGIAIQYRTDRVYVILHYDPPEYELDFSFGRLGVEDQKDAHSFSSGDLLYLEGTDNWSNYSGYSAYGLENLRRCLPKLAQLLRECGGACLRCDDSVFDLMAMRQQEDCERWHEKQERDRVAEEAEAAWRRGDYHRVRELYKFLLPGLTELEAKRLDYAERHSS